ncbi:MAG: response regulator [Rubrivivax sp.]|nr:MAG: response regulator [Rubrivivax sp.]
MDRVIPLPFRADLQRLVSAALSACNVRKAVLRCGSSVVVESGDDHGPLFVVAAHPFGVGAETFEFQLLDRTARRLEPDEVERLYAVSDAVQKVLERAEAQQHAPIDDWIKNRVAVAVDYVTDSFLLLHTDWTILHVNTQFERTVGSKRADMVGRGLWDAIPQIVGTAFEREIRASMEGTVPRVFELPALESPRWFQSRAFPCEDGLAILTIDISDQKSEEVARAEAERKSLQARRMESLGTLAGGIAHDFNNILSAILGHAGLLADLVPEGAPGRESVEQIGVAGRRARDLVNQILTFSKSTSREVVRVPLQPMVEEALPMLRAVLPSNVTVSASLIDESSLATTLSHTEVQQLLVNLATNASHAMEATGGEIKIQLVRASLAHELEANEGRLLPGVYAQLTVSDTGCGVPPEIVGRLFEPFFTTKLREKGTGLGLHVVSGVVSAHGGAIVVESEVGKGSVFRLYFPATSDAGAAPELLPTAHAMPGNGEHVAYLDDDEVVRLMVERVLAHQGFDVTVFGEPLDLVAAFDADPDQFDLLVTDFSMPGMNGLEVARAVRAVRADIPIIVSTGYAPDELRRDVEALGNAEVLNKEQTFEELGVRASWAVSR